ncbi:unnamed protein product [Fusarium venenatum]|uniref:Uncharacterized protein n=1 Tax=Fusarium venenatum TaxID=56646 RepID=A0A2L2TP93_9HYPO|nr:uncharacterized protein FVRRES_01738 [Fusarium venenatum]CEI65226.1 unnamed protein product [Fusarium venenatum]
MDHGAAAALLGIFLEAGVSMLTLLNLQLFIQYQFKPMTSWDLASAASDRGKSLVAPSASSQASFQVRVFLVARFRACSDKKAKKKKRTLQTPSASGHPRSRPRVANKHPDSIRHWNIFLTLAQRNRVKRLNEQR